MQMSTHYVLRANGSTPCSVERIMLSEMLISVRTEDAGLILSFSSGETVRLFHDGFDYWAERLTKRELRDLVTLAATIDAVIEDDLGQRYLVRNDGSVWPQALRASDRSHWFSNFVRSTHPVSLVVLVICVMSFIYAAIRWVM
jgi:hypothetical protein